jgi:hypothetical protein
MSFLTPKDAVRTTVTSYSLNSGQISVASVNGMGAPSNSAPIAITAVNTNTYGTYPETFATYQATGINGLTITGLSVIDGTDNAWQPGDIVEMRTIARHISDSQASINSILFGTNSTLAGYSANGSFVPIAVGTNLSLNGTTLNATGGGASPGGTNGQVQFNNSGSFGGFTVTGDGTLNTNTGSLIRRRRQTPLTRVTSPVVSCRPRNFLIPRILRWVESRVMRR